MKKVMIFIFLFFKKNQIYLLLHLLQSKGKSGIDPKECVELVQYIMKELNNLKFCGLMTIGRPNAPSDQPDFRVRILSALSFI